MFKSQVLSSQKFKAAVGVGVIGLSIFAFGPSMAQSPEQSPEQSQNQGERKANPQYLALGFSSEQEMVDYYTVASTEITAHDARGQQYDIVVVSPDFSRQMNNTLNPPSATATPNTGGVLLPATPVPAPAPSASPAAPNPTPTPTPSPTPLVLPNLPGSLPPLVTTGNPAIDVLLNPNLVDSWITIGLKVWNIIAQGRPVANVGSQRVAVVPAASIEWTQMSNWQGPVSQTYTVKKKNTFGMTIMEHTYTLIFSYGGQYNGLGAFIANATIVPTTVNVSFGFQLDAEAIVGQPVNMGSQQSPVAGLEMQVRYRLSNVWGTTQSTDAFFLKGNGEIVQLNPLGSVRVK